MQRNRPQVVGPGPLSIRRTSTLVPGMEGKPFPSEYQPEAAFNDPFSPPPPKPLEPAAPALPAELMPRHPQVMKNAEPHSPKGPGHEGGSLPK